MRALLITFGLALAAAPLGRGGDPDLGRIEPRGVSRGETVTLTLHGERLHDATMVHAEGAGIRFDAPEVIDAKQVRVNATAAPDCALGEHLVRLVTRSGVTETRSLWIGAFPVLAEPDANDDPATAPELDLSGGPRTVAGALDAEDVDHFALDVAAGERIAVEVEAMRLGLAMFDPRLELLDDAGATLVHADDTPLLGQDAWFVWRAPRAMRVILRLRDAAWRGGRLYQYRLHVGDFPRPAVVYPAGGRPREEVTVRFLGLTPDEDLERTLTLPRSAPFPFGLHVEEDGVTSPSWTPFRLSGHANALEVEPNDDPSHATVAAGPACALNGVLERPGDVDWFRVPVKAGRELRFRAMGLFLGSPVDVLLTLCDEKGKPLAENDDSGSPDSRLDRKVTEDGVVTVAVRDHRGRGGRDFVYRIEVTELRPSLSLAIPRFGRESQARQALAVPRGGRVATVVRVGRSRFDGEVTFEARGLPTGVTMHAPPIGEADNEGIVVFEATPDATLGAGAVDLLGRTEKTKETPALTGRFRNTAELVTFGPNRSVYHRARLDRLTLAVVEAPPFTLTLTPPTTELVQGGIQDLAVHVTRDDGYDGPITIRRLWLPRGTSAPATITVKPGVTDATFRLDARADARRGEYRIALLGEADSGGTTFQASSHVPLRVTAPYLTGKCALAAVERGGRAELVCALDVARPFTGAATARLRNLPSGVTAGELPITSASTEAVFPLEATAKARLGTAKNLFVEVVLETDGGPILFRTATGGQLRVDPPSAGVTKVPAPEDGPRRSRLEQLRFEAERRAELRRGAVAGDAAPSESGG